jgi:hypothetical protein
MFDAQNSPTLGILAIIILRFAKHVLEPNTNEPLDRRPRQHFDASTKRPALSVMGSILYPGSFQPYGRATEIL